MRAVARKLAAMSGGVFLAVAGAPAVAQESEAALIGVLAQRGCEIGPDEVAATFAPEGFTPEFVRETLTGWILDGTASRDARGRLSLPPSLCPAEEATPSPRQSVLRGFAEDGCRLSDTGAGTLEDRFDLSRPQLQAIVQPLYDAGQLTVTGRTARLDDSLCRAVAQGA